MGTNVKQTPIPVVPMTMKIVNADGTPTRSGQLLLQQLQASNTIFGTHDTRPAPGDAPSGALYFETDRGVLYSNENGNWQYVAGTMYATLNPDQRPTDLGQYDGGFEFVANDTDPAIRGRSFIWDGAAWVETTPVLYGLHADRPAVADAPARCLYMETDRGSVIYQNQGTAWEYIAGTMFGTVAPTDERPTDLGTTDAGFDFRTNVDPARQFLWSGAAWIETTPIRYGTHAERLATPVAGLVSGMFWTETDRGNVIYQIQSGVWLFLDGTMWGTLVPDERPTDLGVNDDGFTFLATVTPLRSFIWASPVWVETTNPTGASALIHPNVVTKVGPVSGSIVEGGITDLSAGNSGVVNITAAGKVGIGTASPGYSLSVLLDQNDSTAVSISNPNAGSNAYSALYFGNDASALIGAIWVQGSTNTAGNGQNGLTLYTGAGPVIFTPQGAERMRITPSGNVGIGNQAAVLPDATADIHVIIGSTTATSPGRLNLATVQSSTAALVGSLAFANYAIAGSEKRIAMINAWTDGATNSGALLFYAFNAGVPSEKMRLTSAGDLGLGLTGPIFQFQLSADSAAKPSTSTWTVPSDIRLKQNIQAVKDDSLAILGKLNWVRYEYNGQANMPRGLKAIGLNAQALREQLPEAVRSARAKLNETDTDEIDLLAIDYHHIIVHSARAIQQLDAEVKTLRAMIEKITGSPTRDAGPPTQ